MHACTGKYVPAYMAIQKFTHISHTFAGHTHTRMHTRAHMCKLKRACKNYCSYSTWEKTALRVHTRHTYICACAGWSGRANCCSCCAWERQLHRGITQESNRKGWATGVRAKSSVGSRKRSNHTQNSSTAGESRSCVRAYMVPICFWAFYSLTACVLKAMHLCQVSRDLCIFVASV